MIDLYLRAATEADLADALPFARQEDLWIEAGPDFALSLIGPAVLAEGEYDDDGAEISAPVIDSRYHANLRCSAEIAEQVPATIIIERPATPARVWA